jgi:hypothetical protein
MRARGAAWRIAWLVPLAGLGLAGLGADCGRQEAPGPRGEDLTITVEADRSKLGAEEQKLRAQVEAFEAERQALREERSRLMGARDEGKDETSARRLRELEQRLWERERGMWAREAELEKARAQLAQSKDQILDRLPVVARPAAGSDPQALAGREGALAGRENRMAEREKVLAERERKLAEREEALAEREAECGRLLARVSGASRPTPAARPAPPEGAVGQAEAERQASAAEAALQAKGLRWDDLPSELAGIRTKLGAARRAKDWPRLRELGAQLEATVVATVVDSGFIDRKFARLNQAIKARPPADKKSVSGLLRRATQLIGDGQFQAANNELNKIFGLLPR